MAEDKKATDTNTIRSVRAAVKNFEEIADSQANNPEYRPPKIQPPTGRGRGELISSGIEPTSTSSCDDVSIGTNDDENQLMSLAERMEALRKSMRGRTEPRRSVDPVMKKQIGSIKDHMRQSMDSFENSVRPPDENIRTVSDVRNAVKFREPAKCDNREINRNSSVFESNKRNSDIISDATPLSRIPPKPTPRKSKQKKDGSFNDGSSGTLERSQSCDDLLSAVSEPVTSPRSYHSHKGLNDFTISDHEFATDFEVKCNTSSSDTAKESEVVQVDQVSPQVMKSRRTSEIINGNIDTGFTLPGKISTSNDDNVDKNNVNNNLNDTFTSVSSSPSAQLHGSGFRLDKLMAEKSPLPNFDKLKGSDKHHKSGSIENLSTRSRSTKRSTSSARSKSAVDEKSTNHDFQFEICVPLPGCYLEEEEFNMLVSCVDNSDIQKTLSAISEKKSSLSYLLPLFKICEATETKNQSSQQLQLLEKNLIKLVRRKLTVLQKEKAQVSTSICELDEVKSKLDALMKSYAGMRQYSKFRQYTEDVDKLLHLLSMLSERLARLHNMIWWSDPCRDTSAAPANLESLTTKYEDQLLRFNEAVQLKENIDGRSYQMAQCAKNCLSASDWLSYRQFFFDKYRLFISQVSLDNRIAEAEDQLKALQELEEVEC